MFAKQHVSLKSERKLFRNQVPESMTDWWGQEFSIALVKLGITIKLIYVKIVKISMSRPMLCNNRTFEKLQ